jgi:5-deoxy-glucuronate isomerase
MTTMQSRPSSDIVDDDPHGAAELFQHRQAEEGRAFDYQVPGYETCIVPATGTVTVEDGGETFAKLGNRGVDVWDGEPEGVYVPTGKGDDHCADRYRNLHRRREIRRDAGALRRAASMARPCAIRLGRHQDPPQDQAHPRRRNITTRWAVCWSASCSPSGQGGWSGFPSHKHDTDRLPDETRHDETYNFRFRPNYGSGVQMLQRRQRAGRRLSHRRWLDGSDRQGLPPLRRLPGYEMYYFTILGGLSQRSLKQYFQPTHA